jgi:hypothetical protein
MELLFVTRAQRALFDAQASHVAAARAEIDAARKDGQDSEISQRLKRLTAAQAAMKLQEHQASARMRAALAAAQEAIANGTDPAQAEADYRAAQTEHDLAKNRPEGALQAVAQAKRLAAADYRRVVTEARTKALKHLQTKTMEVNREACRRLESLIVELWSYSAAAAALAQDPLNAELPDPQKAIPQTRLFSEDKLAGLERLSPQMQQRMINEAVAKRR